MFGLSCHPHRHLPLPNQIHFSVLGLFGPYEDESMKIKGQWYFKKLTIYSEGLEGRQKAGWH